jgi:phosphoglycolate phosphatase-like HAD superfamily hydrolase
MVRLVLFDIDGTLVHTAGAGIQSFALAFAEEFGIAGGTDRLNFNGRTDVSLVREFFEMNGVEMTPANVTRFFDAYVERLHRLIPARPGRVCPGIPEFLAALKRLPQPPAIGLLTGNIRRGAEIKLGHYGLWREFPFGGFADDSEDRGLIAVAAQRRGAEYLGREVSGNEIVVVGDTPLDIQCARVIQARPLAVATGNYSVEQLREFNPEWAVDNLGCVSAAEICA